jgi:hypothetical protein
MDFFQPAHKVMWLHYSSTPLPITLLNFTVTKQGDNAQLNWSTSSEENNKGFEIQRSTDQSNWTVLNFIAGAETVRLKRIINILIRICPPELIIIVCDRLIMMVNHLSAKLYR